MIVSICRYHSLKYVEFSSICAVIAPTTWLATQPLPPTLHVIYATPEVFPRLVSSVYTAATNQPPFFTLTHQGVYWSTFSAEPPHIPPNFHLIGCQKIYLLRLHKFRGGGGYIQESDDTAENTPWIIELHIRREVGEGCPRYGGDRADVVDSDRKQQ